MAITGKVVRAKDVGLERVEETETAAGLRTIPLPRFALEMLEKRATEPRAGTLDVVIPSAVRTLPFRGGNSAGPEQLRQAAAQGSS